MAGRVSLVVTAGPIRGRRFDFSGHDTFLFGRAPDCHARLDASDASASRHHFLLEVNPPHARLRDLGSLNGTHVNGVRHGGRRSDETPEQAKARGFAQVDLRDGDEIRVGATIIRVAAETPASQAPRPRGPLESAAAAAAADDSALPGRVVGPYVVEALLGKGGMGAVYRARHGGTGPPVALKILLPREDARLRGRGALPARDRGHARPAPPEHRLAPGVRAARGAHVLRPRVLRARERREAPP